MQEWKSGALHFILAQSSPLRLIVLYLYMADRWWDFEKRYFDFFLCIPTFKFALNRYFPKFAMVSFEKIEVFIITLK